MRSRVRLFGVVAALAALVTLGLTSCALSGGQDLPGIKWVLESYGPLDNPADVIKDTGITAEFDRTDEQIRGTGGCNTYFSQYGTRRGNELSILAPLARTEMWCAQPEGLMDQEDEYLTILGNAVTYRVTGDELSIFSSNDQVLVYYAE